MLTTRRLSNSIQSSAKLIPRQQKNHYVIENFFRNIINYDGNLIKYVLI